MRYNEFRHWLISVAFLDPTSPTYLCACVNAIAGTYIHFGKIPTELCVLAVIDYLRHNSDCYSPALDMEFAADSLYAAQHGLDATHLPPLDSIELGFLLDHNAVPSAPNATSGLQIASFTGSPNPFTKSTNLTFMLHRMTYVAIAIYDDLGRMYWGDGKGRSLDMGTHTIHIDGADLPSGTLYARISTGFGEVKTVKLIKN